MMAPSVYETARAEASEAGGRAPSAGETTAGCAITEPCWTWLR